ncbi:MAG: alpha/beta hydrolase [Acidimicrobiales bacterium]
MDQAAGRVHGRQQPTRLEAPAPRERGGFSAGLLAVAVVILLAACGWLGDEESPEQTAPFAVGIRSVTFVDKSRPTPAFATQPVLDSRTIETEIWYPAEGRPAKGERPDAPAADGPFPLIVFNHGQQGEPKQYTSSFQAWARAGYVVAAPRNPISVRGGPGGQFFNDLEGMLGDTSFVISRTGEELPDLVDLDHVAVAGHSSGAIVALAEGFNTCCHDERIDAVLVESALRIPVDGGEYAADLEGTPVFFLHGDADVNNPVDSAFGLFEDFEAPKFFLTIKGGDHSNTFRDGEGSGVVADASRAFFDRYLKDQEEALDELRAIVSRSPSASLEAVPDGDP